MVPQHLFNIIISITIAGYLADQWLNFLNTTTRSKSLPDKLKAFYDEQTYFKQQKYEAATSSFGFITDSLSFIAVMAMLLSGGFGWLDTYIRSYTTSTLLQTLYFFAALAVAAEVLSIPADLYRTFVIEQRFGFNKTTPSLYLVDLLKGWLLAIIIGGGLLTIIVLIYQQTGDWFWLFAWMLITFFTVFISYFYTTLLVPVFNKLSPLPEGELRTEIEKVVVKTGFNLRNIFVIDGSKRSTRANAYFSGFGKKKTIVLYDTLLNDHSIPELLAILAHEIGHYRKKHVLKGLLTGIFQTAVILFLLSLLLKSSVPSVALGAEHSSFHLSVVVFGILFSPVSMLIGVFMNKVSRKHEFEADRFAAANTNAEDLKNALINLSVKNLSNLTPHPWYVFVYYSHPTLIQRISAPGLNSSDDITAEF